MGTVAQRAADWRQRIAQDLWGNVVPFWLRHSIDREVGGYFNCLDRDGQIFDSTKHVWLQAREVWTFAKLAHDPASPAERREELLDGARHGAEFLARHAVGTDGRAYFALTRDGRPAQIQRKIFSECFLVMAFAEFARASGDASYRERALTLFERVLALVDDPSPLGRPVLEGAPPAIDLAVPMILLNLISELRGSPGSATFDDRGDYAAIEQRCVRDALRHYDPASGHTHERVAPDGARLAGSEGRLLNPGHATEAAWFLIDHARRTEDEALLATALAMLRSALDFGWDAEHGGLFYFLDSDGYSPTQLEWSQKLWWPHCEALIATLLAWRATGDAAWFERFESIAHWTYARFPDPDGGGEWFGYLDRSGAVSQRFKGGPYKGCFHVPRALWRAERLLANE